MAGKAGSHHTDPPSRDGAPKAHKAPEGRALQHERLADALRTNLRRRKEQARERPPTDGAPVRPTLIDTKKS
jgi:hypothetical protein